jgi:hypothetical protein
MNNIRRAALAAAIAIVVASPMPALAHHSHSSLDRNSPTTLFGTITEYMWRSPHVYIKAEVMGSNGEPVEYTIETLNPPALAKVGWGPDTMQPGDKVMWSGNHDRDPNRAYTGLDWMEKIGGYKYFADSAGLEAYLEENNISEDVYLGLAPVQPASRLGEGVWERIGADGGRFPAIRAPEADWPYTELAAAEVAAFTEDQNPVTVCEYPGVPKSMTAPLNYRWSYVDDQTIRIERDLMPNDRFIHLNADAPAGERSNVGHSIGHFEDDGTLVVETNNFAADAWGTYSGVNSSEQKEVVERFKLSDDGMRIDVEITVTDPVYLREPVTFAHQWGKISDRPISQAECSLDNANYYLTAGYEE